MSKLTDLDYWKSSQGEPSINLEENNIIREWLNGNLNFNDLETCFEVGCFPGRYLSIFADHGIEVNGIDYLPAVRRIPELFALHGKKTGDFFCEDFLLFETDKKFDCVYSLGFIEHFANWEEILEKQFDLVREGGIIIVEVPNFRGWMQRLPRTLFDKESLARHNLDSMVIESWIEILRKNSFEVLRADYIGGYMLWFEKEGGNIWQMCRAFLLRILRGIKFFVYPGISNHSSFSGALGVIARRRGVESGAS
jgi:SAM-dependent methyltransferase